MSRVAESIVVMIASVLPPLRRARYREEWLADLAGAEEAEVSRIAIIAGALSTAVTIDRLDPAASGMSLGRSFLRRLRVATGFGLAATVLAVGAGLSGSGSSADGPLGIALVAVALLGAGIAALAGVGAVRAALAAGRPGVAALVVLGALVLVALVVSRAGAIVLVLGAAPGMIGLALIAVMLTGGRIAGRAFRILAAVVVPIAALALTATGLVHVFVGNPLAKVPGMTLSEIYAALAAAGELPAGGPVTWIVAVGCVVGLAAAAYAVFALAPVRAWNRARTRRRLLALGSLVITGSVAAVFVPAFSMGMGIADTFATSGGDATGVATALALVGLLAVAVTIVVSFVRVEPGPPTGEPRPV